MSPAPAVTRIVFSEQDLRARAWLKGLCQAAGLDVREDAVGQHLCALARNGPRTPLPIGTGSHIDAIPHSGRYDGTVGVLGGLEAIRALQESGFQPRRSLELLLFTSEEPTLFGIGCLGSRLLSGTLDAAVDDTLRRRRRKHSLREIRTQAGFRGDLDRCAWRRATTRRSWNCTSSRDRCWNGAQVPIGAVTAIAAPASLRHGNSRAGRTRRRGAHAGPPRRVSGGGGDCSGSGSRRRSTGAIDSVATTGVCDIFPRAINSIPSRVHLEADIRDIDGDRARRHARKTGAGLRGNRGAPRRPDHAGNSSTATPRPPAIRASWPPSPPCAKRTAFPVTAW